MKIIEITDEQYRELKYLGIPFEDVCLNSKSECNQNSKFNEHWKPEYHGDYFRSDKYYFLDDLYSVHNRIFEDDIYDKKRIKVGNYFKTKEQAEQRAKEIKVYNLLKNFSEANGGDKIDWNKNVMYYEIQKTQGRNTYFVCSTITCRVGCIYFISDAVAEEALRRYKKELEELINE